MTDDKQHAPSATRRMRLKEREAAQGKNFMKVLDSYPIDKYYDMSERLLLAFNLALDDRRLDDAYVFGLRFATFSIESLPRHFQYNHPHHKRQRAKNARHVDDVLKKLESVASRMDAEELRLARQRREAQEAQQQEEAAQEERRLQEQATRQQRHREVLQQQREELQAEQKAQMEQRALEKLKLLNQQNPQTNINPQQRGINAAISTNQLLPANTGQSLHTKEAVAEQKARLAQEAARQKEEQEKTEVAIQSQVTAPKLNLFQKVAKMAVKAPAAERSKSTKATTIKEPSSLDPKLLAQTNQLKEEIAKADSASLSKPADDYKSEFAKFQAEWRKSKQPIGDSTKKDDLTLSSESTHDKGRTFQSTPNSNSSLQVLDAPAEGPPATKQISNQKFRPQCVPTTADTQRQQASQDITTAVKNESVPNLSPTRKSSSLQSAVVEVCQSIPQPKKSHSVPKETSKFPIPSMKLSVPSQMKLFQLSPKRKSTKQVAQEPTEEGVELKLTDAGPTVVDDFSYHDDAYKAKLTPSERKTFKLLEEAIHLQEQRLQVLESSNERSRLRLEAKKRLNDGDRKGALHCLAKKKRINLTIELVKQTIFNMETQTIMLESAVENREVNKIMKEASDVMASYGNNIRVSDFTDEKLGDVLASVGQGDMDYDEEELLSELHDGEDVVPVKSVGDDDGFLSLPSAPKTEVTLNELPKNNSAAVQHIVANLF